MPKTRNQYSADQKVAILRRHLIDRTSIADLCDEYKIHPAKFYQWQSQFFENGSAAFARKTNSAVTQHQKTIEQLEAKLQRKNEVVSELMEAHLHLKTVHPTEARKPLKLNGYADPN